MSDEDIECLSCDWHGKERDLVEVPWMPEDDYSIPGETVRACPTCQSVAWEPTDS